MKKRVISGWVMVIGASALDLAPEEGDHRAIGSQDITEPGGDEPRSAIPIERLNVNFGHPFRSAHHRSRVHSLIGRYHDEPRSAKSDGQVGDGTRP